jgi:acyl-CoA synthetase (AMP-forming)/AMP-acid ligase II
MSAFLHPDSDNVALIDAGAGTTLAHRQLAERVQAIAEPLRADDRELVFVRARIDTASVVNYLAAHEAGQPVLLLDDGISDELMDELVERYRPRFVMGPAGVEIRESAANPLHPDLRVLLSTSGTTGSPKLVRLSESNVEANARSIAEYLELGPEERAIASLPFHYSYGLSVLNSHLLAEGSIVIPPEGLIRPSFWEAFAEHRCTSFAGVPYSYELLRRVGWEKRELPALRTMTQAGGRLAPERVSAMAEKLAARGARFVVMYGQTEATARISWVPPERLEEKLGSIGIPIPRGSLEVDADGQLVYEGPNVMMGYAEERADLALGDVQHGRLETGDLGHADDDGFFYVTGRLKRFAKIFGLRVNLDDIERALHATVPAAAVGRDEASITVFIEDGHDQDPEQVRRRLAERFKLNPRAFDVRVLTRLPTTTSGKIDYAALADS